MANPSPASLPRCAGSASRSKSSCRPGETKLGRGRSNLARLGGAPEAALAGTVRHGAAETRHGRLWARALPLRLSRTVVQLRRSLCSSILLRFISTARSSFWRLLRLLVQRSCTVTPTPTSFSCSSSIGTSPSFVTPFIASSRRFSASTPMARTSPPVHRGWINILNHHFEG